MKIYVAQINSTVGDLKGNTDLILSAYKEGVSKKADIVMLPELALSGYSPEDLLLSAAFLQDVTTHINEIAKETTDVGLLFGTPYPHEKEEIHSIPMPGQAYNAAVFCHEGKIKHITHKSDLPNFGVFDEKRYFQPAKKREIFEFKGVKIGVPICRDTWLPDTCKELADLGAEILLSPNASPYHAGKYNERFEFIHKRTTETGCPLLYLNLVGGQDGVVFDGRSFTMNPGDIEPSHMLKAWEEDIGFWQLEKVDKQLKFIKNKSILKHPSREKDVYNALKTGLRDYVYKNGFSNVVIGLSGGVDSALTAAIAVDTLGKENVLCVIMPSEYTLHSSVTDAWQLADVLGCDCTEIDIEPAMKTMDNMYEGSFEEKPRDLAAENLQARIRGTMLMTISNSVVGSLLLTTGNKSEIATGYCTLYGDMCGGFSVLKDVYKTDVYKLCEWRNKKETLIPERILTKPPSAELSHAQTDQDSLPDYEILDGILKLAIEGRQSAAEIIEEGFDKGTVTYVLKMLKTSEYKRRQSAPGVKTTALAFERDWRWPLTSKY
jgi:NAD+ synthetase